MPEKINFEYPQVVFRTGEHNAFTSLCRSGKSLYMAFRNAADHLEFNGMIIFMRSDNEGKFWYNHSRLSVPGYDLRDPCLVNDEDTLLLYTSSRKKDDSSVKVCPHLFKASAEEDFVPVTLHGLPDGVFFWKIIKFGNRFFGSGYCSRGSGQTAWLFDSKDGVHWKTFVGPFDGNELAFDISDDGIITGVLRREHPPYYYPQLLEIPIDAPKKIRCEEIKYSMQGIMVKKIGNRKFVIARRWDRPGRKRLRIEIFEINKNGTLNILGQLPSGGDCSYASFVETNPGCGLLAYYSSHHYLYGMETLPDPEHSLPADIFMSAVSVVQ